MYVLRQRLTHMKGLMMCLAAMANYRCLGEPLLCVSVSRFCVSSGVWCIRRAVGIELCFRVSTS